MASEWYYSHEGKRYGPMPLSELKKLAEAGELGPSDFVRKEGLPEWVEASSIKELILTEDRSFSQCPPPLPSEAVGEEPTSLSQGFLTPELHAKAEHNHLQAQFKFNECQAHLGVYGNRLVSVAEDGLEFIEAALRINPESSAYWNTKGVLLTSGLGEHQKALDCFRRALELEPDSIVIKQNIRNAEQNIGTVKQHKELSRGCLGMFLVLAASGLGMCTALSILLAR